MRNLRMSTIFKDLIPILCFLVMLTLIKCAGSTQETTSVVRTATAHVLLQQYEKQLSQDSCLVCLPDTAHMIFTKHNMFAISGVIRVWVHKLPTYEGFKEYIFRIDSLRNVIKP